jgi:putative oxidoreductase
MLTLQGQSVSLPHCQEDQNMTPSTTTAAAQLSARLLMSVIFIVSGVSKVAAYAATQGYMESAGVPGALLPAVIALEIGAALALVLGWQARISAFLLAGFSILSALIFHSDFGDQMQSILFMKNLAIAGGLLMVVANGAGTWSVDAQLQSPRGGLHHA